MKKKQYRSRKGKYFMGFLPKEKFLNLTEKEKKYYRLYRNNHRWMYEGEEKIKEWKTEIDKLKKKIKEKELQIKGDENNDGWKQKMIEGYSEIGYLSKDYDFFCSVNLRTIESKTLKNQKKGIRGGRELYNTSDVWGDKGNRNNPSEDWKTFKSKLGKGKGKEVVRGKEYKKYYIRIEPKGRGWIRNLYVGKREDVLYLLKTYSSDIEWEKKSEKYVRDNLREIYKGYVRYHIYENGVENMKKGSENPLSQHPLSNVLDWVTEMGNKIFDWMDN